MIHGTASLQPDEEQSGPFEVHGLVHWQILPLIIDAGDCRLFPDLFQGA
jgi:hypothetical protein